LKNDYENLLRDTFSVVIEKLAFMFVEEAEEEKSIETDSKFLKARMTFNGAMAGAFTLVVSEKMCSDIAANILGIDSVNKIGKAKMRDALKEVLNVVCGNFLTALAGDKSVFELSLPVVSEINEKSKKTLLNERNALELIIDNRPVLLHFFLENQE